MSNLARLAISLAICCFTVGCVREKQEKLVPVSGTISVAHNHLSSGTVVFHPDASRGNVRTEESRGSIDANGVYHLSTGGRSGAPVGWFKVTVYAIQPPKAGEGMKPPVWLAAQRYTDSATSDLSVEVLDNPVNPTYDFDLER